MSGEGAAAVENLVVPKGTLFDETFQYVEADEVTIVPLLNRTGLMEVRDRDDSPDPPRLTLSTANGGIVIDGAQGTVQLIIGATASEAAIWDHGVYDLKLIHTSDPDDVIGFMRGVIDIDRNPTRLP